MVRMVPNDNPAMIVIAMAFQNTSGYNGITPSTVVAAASSTGRRRVTPAATIDSYRDCPEAS